MKFSIMMMCLPQLSLPQVRINHGRSRIRAYSAFSDVASATGPATVVATPPAD
jgi:hypothetical protein